jgi:hypothetical protein
MKWQKNLSAVIAREKQEQVDWEIGFNSIFDYSEVKLWKNIKCAELDLVLD